MRDTPDMMLDKPFPSSIQGYIPSLLSGKWRYLSYYQKQGIQRLQETGQFLQLYF